MTEPSGISTSVKTDAEIIREVQDTTLPFDPDLARLATFVNLIDTVEIGITLHVSGSVVSGMLISNGQFYRMLIKEIAASGGNSASSFADFYRLPLQDIDNDLKIYRETQKLPPPPRHIHLRVGQTFINPREPVIASLWRGRLASVDGWSMGNMGSIPPLNRADWAPETPTE